MAMLVRFRKPWFVLCFGLQAGLGSARLSSQDDQDLMQMDVEDGVVRVDVDDMGVVNVFQEQRKQTPVDAWCGARTIDLSNVVQSNLAGQGPDSGAEELRYAGVFDSPQGLVDLVITAPGGNYLANNPSKNGVNDDYQSFGILQFQCAGRFDRTSFRSHELEFCFKTQDGNLLDASLMHTIAFTFYDFDAGADQGHGQRGRENLTSCDHDNFYTPDDSSLNVEQNLHGDGCTTWGSSEAGGTPNNPTTPEELTDGQNSRSLRLMFQDKASFQLRMDIGSCGTSSYPISGRWLFFAGTPAFACCAQTHQCSAQGTPKGVPGECTCECDAGWSGADCSCAPGSCVNGDQQDDCSCVCHSGWGGDQCSECSPPFACENGGILTSDKCGCQCTPGSCVNGDQQADCSCVCQDGWTGDQCSECSPPLTCENGGIQTSDKCGCQCTPGSCVNGDQQADCSCVCQDGWIGDQCSNCFPPVGCVNNGIPMPNGCGCVCRPDVCVNGVQQDDCSCVCHPGWGGETCDECSPAFTCQNMGFQTPDKCGCICRPGSCVNGERQDDCSCDCHDGFECSNGGTLTDSCTCACQADFCQRGAETTETCGCSCGKDLLCFEGGTRNPDCSCECTNQCHHGGTHGDDCSCQCTNECLHGGSRNSDCSCDCPVGLGGDDCSSCLHSCHPDGTEIFHDAPGCGCTCKPGFTGDDCEQELDDCGSYSDLACVNGFREGDWVPDCWCRCHNGWTGDACDQSISCIIPGRDYLAEEGQFATEENVNTAEECQQICADDPRCHHFTHILFEDAEGRNLPLRCYLLFDPNPSQYSSVPLPGAASGPAFCSGPRPVVPTVPPSLPFTVTSGDCVVVGPPETACIQNAGYPRAEWFRNDECEIAVTTSVQIKADALEDGYELAVPNGVMQQSDRIPHYAGAGETIVWKSKSSWDSTAWRACVHPGFR